jgi:hypothetical protein
MGTRLATWIGDVDRNAHDELNCADNVVMIRSATKLIVATGGLAAFIGCAGAPATLHLASREVRDSSVRVREQKRYASLMVLPPRGSERGEITVLAKLEMRLLRWDFRVISSGVTGRAVQDPSGTQLESAAQLSDLERALVLAKRSNAEALFQVGRLDWVPSKRSFVCTDTCTEVALGTPVLASDLIQVQEATLFLEGKLIDVEDGAVVMAFDIAQSTSQAVPNGYAFTIQRNAFLATGQRQIVVDNPQLRERAIAQVLTALERQLRIVSNVSGAVDIR